MAVSLYGFIIPFQFTKSHIKLKCNTTPFQPHTHTPLSTLHVQQQPYSILANFAEPRHTTSLCSTYTRAAQRRARKTMGPISRLSKEFHRRFFFFRESGLSSSASSGNCEGGCSTSSLLMIHRRGGSKSCTESCACLELRQLCVVRRVRELLQELRRILERMMRVPEGGGWLSEFSFSIFVIYFEVEWVRCGSL